MPSCSFSPVAFCRPLLVRRSTINIVWFEKRERFGAIWSLLGGQSNTATSTSLPPRTTRQKLQSLVHFCAGAICLPSTSLHGLCSGKEDWIRVGGLLDQVGLSGQGGLVDLEIIRLDEDAVRRQEITWKGPLPLLVDRRRSHVIFACKLEEEAAGALTASSKEAPPLTVFDTGDVAHDEFIRDDVDGLSSSDHRELVFRLDLGLQP